MEAAAGSWRDENHPDLRTAKLEDKVVRALPDKLRLIPLYTNKRTLEEILTDKRVINLLWLEILFNDGIDWEDYLSFKEIREAYEKACIWYSNFRTVMEANTHRKPLKRIEGRIDDREYRRFMEVLNFVSA